MTPAQITQLSTAKAQDLALSLADSLGVVIDKWVCKCKPEGEPCQGVWVLVKETKISEHYVMIGGKLIEENKADCIPF